MKLIILLDFDGVLFNSAFEAYTVCEVATQGDLSYRSGIPFEEFMSFRSLVTDAWQFNRLYSKDHALRDPHQLMDLPPSEEDWAFAARFFEARAGLMKDQDWPKLMSPYPFFHQLRPVINAHPDWFKILSTRNEASIALTLDFYAVQPIGVWGQEQIRVRGSKMAVAEAEGWLERDVYTVYVDDMSVHLEPFLGRVDHCVHAGWGYDASTQESYTQTQAVQMIQGLIAVYRQKKFR